MHCLFLGIAKKFLKVSCIWQNNLTPNMHLAAHIIECIKDHGPVYSFWLFAFKRMNGNCENLLVCKLLTFSHGPVNSDVSSIQFWINSNRNMSLSENVKLASSEIQPLPEKVFDDLDLHNIKSIMNSIYPTYT